MRRLAVVALLMLAGCRGDDMAAADNRLVWDAEGCAFHVRPNVWDTSFVKRLPDADKATCPHGGPGQQEDR